MSNVNFGGFWCRHCLGRVFEDEIYTEVDPNTRRKSKKVELTCSLCARNYRCKYSDYVKLLENIEHILIEKRASKANKKPLLPLR